MSSIPGSIPVTGFIAPTDTTDKYPVTDAIYGIDGLRNVSDYTERDNISLERRRAGMVVGTLNDNKYWRLKNQSWTLGDPSDWELFLSIGPSGSVVGTGLKYYIEPTDDILIPAYTQYWVYGGLTVSGQLTNYGQVVIANGTMSIVGGTFSNFGSLTYVDISGGGSSGDLATVLDIGNETGGNDISITDGDVIQSQDKAIQLSFGNGNFFKLTTDQGSSNEGVLYLSPTYSEISNYATDGYVKITTDSAQALFNSSGLILGEALDLRFGNGDSDPNTSCRISGASEGGVAELYMEIGKGNGLTYTQNNIDVVADDGASYVVLFSTYVESLNHMAQFKVDGYNSSITADLTDADGVVSTYLTLQTGAVTLQDPSAEGIVALSTNSHSIVIEEANGINIRTFNNLYMGSDDIRFEFDGSQYIFRDNSFNRGIQYYDDYGTSFTERSLVDKGFVNQMAGMMKIASISYTEVNSNTASNSFTLPYTFSYLNKVLTRIALVTETPMDVDNISIGFVDIQTSTESAQVFASNTYNNIICSAAVDQNTFQGSMGYNIIVRNMGMTGFIGGNTVGTYSVYVKLDTLLP